jgi:predicted homoserine dehydrogenase-like protein
MIYQHLFERIKTPETVKAALIGAGQFGTSIVTQAPLIPRLDLVAVADLNIEAARNAYLKAGRTHEQIAACDSRTEALSALQAGKVVIVEDALLLMDLPLHVIASATRVPEAAAFYADEVIRHGKHLVMIDKEADATVGPVLKSRADAASVVYTTDDGDQPGLLMGLAAWAEALGMEVLSGGDLRSALYDPAAGTVSRGGRTVHVPEEDRWALERIPAGEAARYAEARERILGAFREDDALGDPMCHMAVAANGTGLMPERPIGHRPTLRMVEIPSVLCPQRDGGILQNKGVLDVAYVLHTEDQPHGGGGVYIVVANADPVSCATMVEKGLHANADGTAMLVYRPYHLCGAETAMSMLCAGLLQTATGAAEMRPRVDIIATTGRAFRAGETISRPGGLGYYHDLPASLGPALPLAPDNPVPYFMLEGRRLLTDVPTGTVITAAMVEEPRDSDLWALRREQDAQFL